MKFLPDRGHVHHASSDITPRSIYESRRDVLRGFAAGAAGAALASWAARSAHAQTVRPGKLAALNPTRRNRWRFRETAPPQPDHNIKLTRGLHLLHRPKHGPHGMV